LLSAFDSATGAITYTPAHGYSGADTFTFTVNDGTVNSPTGTISIVVQALTDDDLDGMPDAWETEHGVSDPNDDPDGDGFTNAQEYAANTDPQSPASALRITGIAQDSSGQTTIVWDSVAGVRYRVQYSDGDASGNFDGVFTDILRPPVVEIATGSSTSFTDDFTLTSGPPTTGQRYFRVKVAP
jgi:hypothetical protein